jgi:hypothetical protein
MSRRRYIMIKALNGVAALSCLAGLIGSAAVGASEAALLCAILGGMNYYYWTRD